MNTNLYASLKLVLLIKQYFVLIFIK